MCTTNTRTTSRFLAERENSASSGKPAYVTTTTTRQQQHNNCSQKAEERRRKEQRENLLSFECAAASESVRRWPLGILNVSAPTKTPVMGSFRVFTPRALGARIKERKIVFKLSGWRKLILRFYKLKSEALHSARTVCASTKTLFSLRWSKSEHQT